MPTASAARSSVRCCCAPTGRAVEPHDVEAFGPVSTVIGYDDLDDAIALAARGKGSLAGSLVTHDPEVARTVTLGLAPWHGRILVLDRDDAGESTGHGVPLPTLVHGGPGRAGGGEEMGGAPWRRAPDAADRAPGLARHAHRDHRPVDQGLGDGTTTACTRSARAWPSCASATPSRPGRAG